MKKKMACQDKKESKTHAGGCLRKTVVVSLGACLGINVGEPLAGETGWPVNTPEATKNIRSNQHKIQNRDIISNQHKIQNRDMISNQHKLENRDLISNQHKLENRDLISNQGKIE